MRLHSLHMENFRLHADTDIDFPEGVVALVGDNESGKSSVLEALELALFGGSATRGNVDSIRWKGAPPRKVASVTPVFTLGGVTYRVERSETNAKVWDHTTGVVLAEGKAAVSEFMPTILKMDHATFRSSFLCAQKEVARIATMGPTERQAFVRRIMGMEKVDEAIKACRKKKTALSEEKRGLEAGLGSRDPLDEAVLRARTALEEVEEKVHLLQVDVGKKEVVYVKAQEVAGEFREASAAQDILKARVSNAADRLTELQAKAGKTKTDLEEAKVATQAIASFPGPRLALLKEIADKLWQRSQARKLMAEADAKVEEKRRDLEAVEADLTSFRRVSQDVPENLNEKEAELTDLKSRLYSMEQDRMVARGEAQVASKRAIAEANKTERKLQVIREAGVEGECPTCLRALEESFAVVVETLEKELERWNGEATTALAVIEDAKSPSDDEMSVSWEIDTLEVEVGEMRLRVRQASTAATQVEQTEKLLEVRINNLNEAQAFRDSIEEPEGLEGVDAVAVHEELRKLERDQKLLDHTKAGGLPVLNQNLEDTLAQISKVEDELKEAEAELAANPFDEEAATDAHAGEVEARQAWVDAKQNLSGVEGEVRGLTSALSSAERAVRDWELRAGYLVEVTHQHALHEKVDAKLTEFRTAVAKTIRPEMEDLVSQFVRLLTDGRHEAATLTDTFEVILEEDGAPMEVVSGGAEDIAALSLRLALSQMVAERAGHPLSLLILDEPYGSQDAGRRGNIQALLKELRETFKQVIIISHVAETRESADHVVEFHFDPEARRTVVTQEAAA